MTTYFPHLPHFHPTFPPQVGKHQNPTPHPTSLWGVGVVVGCGLHGADAETVNPDFPHLERISS